MSLLKDTANSESLPRKRNSISIIIRLESSKVACMLIRCKHGVWFGNFWSRSSNPVTSNSQRRCQTHPLHAPFLTRLSQYITTIFDESLSCENITHRAAHEHWGYDLRLVNYLSRIQTSSHSYLVTKPQITSVLQALRYVIHLLLYNLNQLLESWNFTVKS